MVTPAHIVESSYWRLSGALAVLAAFPIYRALFTTYFAVGTWRNLALFGVFAALLALAALPVWFITKHIPAQSPLRTHVCTAFFAGALLNLALIGLSIAYFHPRLAPASALAATGAVIGALLVRYLLLSPEYRAWPVRLLVGLGQVAIVLPVVALPILVADAATFVTRYAQSPPAPPPGTPIKPHAPRRIVLISFDGLAYNQSDMASANGPTPQLAALAQDSTRFTWCHSTGDRTRTATLSFLTGLQPSAIYPTVKSPMGFLPKGAVTSVAGYLKPAGYRTHAYTAYHTPRDFGVEDEFDHHVQFYDRGLEYNPVYGDSYVVWKELLDLGLKRWRASEANDLRVAWGPESARNIFQLARQALKPGPEPVFVWAHVFAPHAPYFALPLIPEEQPLPPLRPFMKEWLPNREATVHEAAYKQYVRYLDHEFGHFVRHLRADGVWEDTLLVVLSDHGEQFITGKQGHSGGFVNEPITHIPLVIHAPGQTAPAVRQEPVSTGDVTPTILDAVYAAPVERFAGQSLLGKPLPDNRLLFTWSRYERYTYAPDSLGAIAAYENRLKYTRDFKASTEALYDLARDPTEQVNLAASRPGDFVRLQQAAAQAMPR